MADASMASPVEIRPMNGSASVDVRYAMLASAMVVTSENPSHSP